MDILMKLNKFQLDTLTDAILAARGSSLLAGQLDKGTFLGIMHKELVEILLETYKSDPSIGPVGDRAKPLIADPIVRLSNSVRVTVTDDDGKSQPVFVHGHYELSVAVARIARLDTFGKSSHVTVSDGVNTFRVTPSNVYRKTYT